MLTLAYHNDEISEEPLFFLGMGEDGKPVAQPNTTILVSEQSPDVLRKLIRVQVSVLADLETIKAYGNDIDAAEQRIIRFMPQRDGIRRQIVQEG